MAYDLSFHLVVVGITLKSDKDCVISRDLLQDWIRLVIIPTCRAYGVTVLSVATCPNPRKGFHVYAEISPPVHAVLAWRLQFLLGDDCRRVSLNRARLKTGFSGWNKLFEGIGAKLRTVYKLSNTKPTSCTTTRPCWPSLITTTHRVLCK